MRGTLCALRGTGWAGPTCSCAPPASPPPRHDTAYWGHLADEEIGLGQEKGPLASMPQVAELWAGG